MINCSGQFMRRRVIKDAFPSFTSYLKKQHVISLKAGAVYSHTLGFKLQLAILNIIGTMCRDLEIMDIECEKIIAAILPYLSQAQPLRLQQVIYGLFKVSAYKCIHEQMICFIKLYSRQINRKTADFN